MAGRRLTVHRAVDLTSGRGRGTLNLESRARNRVMGMVQAKGSLFQQVLPIVQP